MAVFAAMWMVVSGVALVENEPPERESTSEVAATPLPTPEPQAELLASEEEITIAARCVWGEARGIESLTEQAAIVWCFANRADEYGKSIGEVVTAPNQFSYDESFPTVDDFGRDLKALVRDVLERWSREHAGETDVGRVLPKDYLYFGGDGERNWFRNDYEFNGDIWDWHLPSPYES